MSDVGEVRSAICKVLDNHHQLPYRMDSEEIYELAIDISNAVAPLIRKERNQENDDQDRNN